MKSPSLRHEQIALGEEYTVPFTLRMCVNIQTFKLSYFDLQMRWFSYPSQLLQ